MKAGCDPFEVDVARRSDRSSRSPTTTPTAISDFELLEGVKVSVRSKKHPAGLRKSFSLTLKPGKFGLWCPGGSEAYGRGTLQARTGTAGR